MNKQILEKIKVMTLKQKIGQLIIGSAEGFEMNGDFETFMREYPLSGLRIYGDNIRDREQVKKFTTQIKKLYEEGIEPILASDQEGGSLSVFGKLMTEFPGNMSLGAADDSKLSFLQGNVSGFELSELGINMAFAPVADLNLQVNNPVIGVRSFGDNSKKVSELCEKYARGLNSGGISGCAKHFPGHGNTNVDSHMDLPSNILKMKEFAQTELVPFIELVVNDIDSVMVSHVLYPNLTGDSIPASLNGKIINGILRRNLQYNGVVMTDNLEMKAITNSYKIRQAARMFILAGGDILINVTRGAVIEAFDSLIDAVAEGVISIDRINESVFRVLDLKQKIERYISERKLLVENPYKLSQDISKKAVTLVKDNKAILPLKKGNRILLIIPEQINLTEADTTGGMENNLFKYIKKYCPDSIIVKTILGRESNLDEIRQLAFECDEIIQCTINCVRFPEQIKIIENICNIKPTLVLMLRDPYDMMLIPEDITVIAAYSAIDSNMEVTCDLIFGKYEFAGKLPVEIHM